MSGMVGANSLTPTKGKRRTTEPCERCGVACHFFNRLRFVHCAPCWRVWWDTRNAIIAERLAVLFPSGRPTTTSPLYATDYAAWAEQSQAYRSAEAGLRNNDRSIPDAEILARRECVA